MKKIKRYYHYFYYRIYRFIEYTSEQMGGKFLTEFKAGITVIAFEIWSLLSIYNYYTIITKENLHLSFKKTLIYIPLIIIILLKWQNFSSKEQWFSYHQQFDALPKKVNKKGGWIVFGITVFIILNLVFSFYLMMQIDWSKYR